MNSIGWVVDDISGLVHSWGHKKAEGHPETGRRFTEVHDLTGMTRCPHCFEAKAEQMSLFNSLSTVATR